MSPGGIQTQPCLGEKLPRAAMPPEERVGPGGSRARWSEEEIRKLHEGLEIAAKDQGGINWGTVAEHVGTRTPQSCLRRYNAVDAFRRGRQRSPTVRSWGKAETLRLLQLIEEYGSNWTLISRRMGRSPNSCKGRLVNVRRAIVQRKADSMLDEDMMQICRRILPELGGHRGPPRLSRRALGGLSSPAPQPADPAASEVPDGSMSSRVSGVPVRLSLASHSSRELGEDSQPPTPVASSLQSAHSIHQFQPFHPVPPLQPFSSQAFDSLGSFGADGPDPSGHSLHQSYTTGSGIFDGRSHGWPASPAGYLAEPPEASRSTLASQGQSADNWTLLLEDHIDGHVDDGADEKTDEPVRSMIESTLLDASRSTDFGRAVASSQRPWDSELGEDSSFFFGQASDLFRGSEIRGSGTFELQARPEPAAGPRLPFSPSASFSGQAGVQANLSVPTVLEIPTSPAASSLSPAPPTPTVSAASIVPGVPGAPSIPGALVAPVTPLITPALAFPGAHPLPQISSAPPMPALPPFHGAQVGFPQPGFPMLPGANISGETGSQPPLPTEGGDLAPVYASREGPRPNLHPLQACFYHNSNEDASDATPEKRDSDAFLSLTDSLSVAPAPPVSSTPGNTSLGGAPVYGLPAMQGSAAWTPSATISPLACMAESAGQASDCSYMTDVATPEAVAFRMLGVPAPLGVAGGFLEDPTAAHYSQSSGSASPFWGAVKGHQGNRPPLYAPSSHLGGGPYFNLPPAHQGSVHLHQSLPISTPPGIPLEVMVGTPLLAGQSPIMGRSAAEF